MSLSGPAPWGHLVQPSRSYFIAATVNPVSIPVKIPEGSWMDDQSPKTIALTRLTDPKKCQGPAGDVSQSHR